MQKQLTLKDSFTVMGKGLHTGLMLTTTVKPAPEDFGYKIKRLDLEGQPVVDCVAENVTDTQRGTVLQKGDVRVSTIEHLMAALYASGVDNCLIETNGPEIPILDGSAYFFHKEIQKVGLKEQNAYKNYLVIRHKTEVKGNNGESLVFLPDENFCLDVMIAFNSKVLANQFATLNSISDFGSEIASARTFVFVREIEPLLNANLIKGGDLDNAIVVYENELTQERFDALADTMGIEHKDATHLGYLNNRPLTWPNEPARHKLLDLMGDLALVGRPIKGRVIAIKPGHSINNKFARELRKYLRKHEVQCPAYDPEAEPVLDINRIRELLPHRYPMQLVDKIIDIDDNYIVGVKNVTINEPFFQGHFPTEPVMPGVLQVEAMAQAGGLLVLNTLENPEEWSTYFTAIDNVKFRKKVVPGDTLIFKVKLEAPVRHGMSSMKGLVFVGDEVVTEAEFTARIIQNKKND